MDNESNAEMAWLQSLTLKDQMAYREISRHGFPLDYFNEWRAFDLLRPQDLGRLQAISTFADYVANLPWDESVKQFALRRSDPKKVKEVDQLAGEFNAAKDRIQSERDIAALQDFYRRAMDIKNS